MWRSYRAAVALSEGFLLSGFFMALLLKHGMNYACVAGIKNPKSRYRLWGASKGLETHDLESYLWPLTSLYPNSSRPVPAKERLLSFTILEWEWPECEMRAFFYSAIIFRNGQNAIPSILLQAAEWTECCECILYQPLSFQDCEF